MAKEVTYGLMVVEVNELNHAQLGSLSTQDVLTMVGKTIEGCAKKQDKIFSKYYTNYDIHIDNKVLTQLSDVFVVVSPASDKQQLQEMNTNIQEKLRVQGVKVKTAIVEYGVDGLDYQEMLTTAHEQIRRSHQPNG
ncbi:hypothetical protein J4457_06820 [Candidatus Woesearchaeota archaeon]|nr:hypothetical protein [Candidatus Woesearchaeota archaeon]